MMFGVLNPAKMWHQQLMHLPISPVYCSHFTLGNPKSHFSTVLFIHTSDYLRYLRRKQTVTPLPTTPEKCHHTTLWNAELIHLMEGILFLSKHWWLWKGEFCCVALVAVKRADCVVIRQAASQQVFKVTTFCTDIRFQPFLPLINCIVHHSAEIQRMSRQSAASTRPYRGLLLDILHASSSYPRCSNQPGWGHDCWLATRRDWWTGVSHSAGARLCHEHDVLARCLGGRQTCLQQAMLCIAGSSSCISNTSQ